MNKNQNNNYIGPFDVYSLEDLKKVLEEAENITEYVSSEQLFKELDEIIENASRENSENN